ncbi:MAG: hypothetical protein JNL98_07540 [Bryobacterales bacterium]|nr:hypothetical protein [Bryobacterales bacterium]
MQITRRMATALAALAPCSIRAQANADLESFDMAWQVVRDRHWDPQLNGVDWDAVKRELRPKLEQAPNRNETRRTISQMLDRLKQSHFGLLPAEVYNQVQAGSGSRSDATPGISVRVIAGDAVITEVRDSEDVRTGWTLKRIGDWEVNPALREIAKSIQDPVTRAFVEAGMIRRRLKGEVGSERAVECLDGQGGTVQTKLRLAEEQGTRASFGLLPPTPVWFETKEPKPGIGYIRFNMFLDPPRLMANFEAAIRKFHRSNGIVIDLRGNPGGLGIMAMGMAGWFVNKEDLHLGTMILRDSKLRFVVNPRLPHFEGPLAMLIDPLSASTSEIFAGGMKDIGRARIFGEKTAGLALPSNFQKLPNGDVLQFAFANYVSASGVPLEANGVMPHVHAPPTREALLKGRDNALEAAIEWIQKEGNKTNAKTA